MNISTGGRYGDRSLLGAGLFACVSTAVVALLLLTSPAGLVASANPVGVGLIPTESGVGDLAYNWLAYQGLLRAETDFGVVGSVYLPSGPGDYAAQIQHCVDDGNALCVTVGLLMAGATSQAAQENPATHFLAIDGRWESYPDNLRGTAFQVEQAAYLAGILAEGMTHSGVVGGVGGLALPEVVAFLDGYLVGAQCADPGLEVLIDYTGTFVNWDLGAQVALQQLAEGAEVVFGCGGDTGNGATLAAAQHGGWAVGVDTDQWYSLFESGAVPFSERLLTSVMRRFDTVVYDTIAGEVGGTFTPGTATYDLANDGVGLAPYHEAEASIPQALKDAVQAARQGILDGTIDPRQPCTARSLPSWRQSNDDGFGDPANGQVPALEVFGDHLYAGTWDSDAEELGFQVWRTANGQAWEQVAEGLDNGAADLAVFDSFLYAGTWNGAVWRSPDGLAWQPVVTGGFGDPNNGIARFVVYDGMLYATTWNSTGTEVWRTADGEVWTQFGEDGLGDPNNNGAIASEVYGGRLYLGIGNWSTGAQLWRTDGVEWEALVTDGFGDAANGAVSSLAEFHGWLYAGLYNESGVQVWRWSENCVWEQVASGGFGNPDAGRANALEVLDGVLYLVVQNDATGLEVWRTANGTDWEQAGFGGFGDANNQWSFWDNGTTPFAGSLYVATNNLATGGEVWQMLQYRISLPLVARSYRPGKITLWHQVTGDRLQEYEAIVAELNQAHPDRPVELVYVEDMDGALADAIPAGTGPDIVASWNQSIGRWASQGYLAPLDDWIGLPYLEANFEPAAVQAVLWDGQIWGIPDWQEGIALVYNTALIGEAQVPLPGDWAGLLAQADQFQQANPGLWYLCNQGLGNVDAYHPAPIFFGHGMSQYGGYVDEHGSAYLDTAEALDGSEWILDMSAYGPAHTDYEICRALMLSGGTAIWWTGPWAIGDLQEGGISYGIAPMGSPFVGVRHLVLTTNAVNRGTADAAVDVIEFFGSAEVQVRLTLANGTIPANTAALHDPEVQAVYEIAQFGEAVSVGVPMGNHVYTDCQWGPVGDAILAIWEGRATPEDAMAAAQAGIEACVAGMGPAGR